MKMIYKMAKTELQTLFYSPIAWLILIVFTFQVGLSFSDVLAGQVRYQELGYSVRGATLNLFVNPWTGGIFPLLLNYLYLYIPLLTMGLISRELSSGSIKLLYSSPVSNTQIILGKYLAVLVYGLVLIMVLLIFVFFSGFAVKEFDFSAVFSGLLGIFLLISAYAAIGLFMSSLTSYQVVAAMLTLAMLAVLNYVKGLGQEIPFVRDITYWLAISGRANEFISGLICSEDVLYFLIVITLFLVWAIVRMGANRQKSPWTVTWGKYVGVFLAAMFLGYLSSRPILMGFHDATRTKVRTLTPNSQEVIRQVKGDMTITTYVNALDVDNLWYGIPRSVKSDMERFKQYTRFKPEIKLKYTYYYDTIYNEDYSKRYPGLTTEERAGKILETYNVNSKHFINQEEIRSRIDLFPEGNTFVRQLVRGSGEKTFLRVYDDMQRFPSEAEITAAFKRVAMKLPKVGFLKGHGERDNRRSGDRDYFRFAQDKPFRYSLLNQGFDTEDVTLDREVPEEVKILVIAEMKSALAAEEQVYLDAYIARGGNLLIAGEPNRREIMNPLVEPFGVQFGDGILVKQDTNLQANLIIAYPTEEGGELTYMLGVQRSRELVTTMPSVSGLEYRTDKGFTVTPLYVTDSLVWNELQTTDFVDDTAIFNPENGEVMRSYVTALALARRMGDNEQKIIILGDADCISNGEISINRKNVRASNYTVVMGGFFWMSDDEVPIDVRRPSMPDDKIYVTKNGMPFVKAGFMGVLPISLIISLLLIWLRRRGR